MKPLFLFLVLYHQRLDTGSAVEMLITNSLLRVRHISSCPAKQKVTACINYLDINRWSYDTLPEQC